MTQKGFYILIVLMLGAMLFISQRYFRGSGNSFAGITSAKPYSLSASQKAIVDSIYVTPGQLVRKNTILVKLRSPELEFDFARLEGKMAVLESEIREKNTLHQSAVVLLKSENQIEAEELKSDINKIASELNLNSKISGKANDADGPMEEQLKSLRTQLQNLNSSYEIRIKDATKKFEHSQKSLKNELDLLQREKNMMRSRQEVLTLKAGSDGVVEKISVKESEYVEEFKELMSLNPVSPTTVIGYLTGKKEIPPVGTSVTIRPFEGGKLLQGTVIGFGSVTELPLILQKSTAVKAFGREVFITIPTGNELATGERVLIK